MAMMVGVRERSFLRKLKNWNARDPLVGGCSPFRVERTVLPCNGGLSCIIDVHLLSRHVSLGTE